MQVQHLIDHLFGRQIAHEPCPPGGTEGAAYGTANLRRDAKRLPLLAVPPHGHHDALGFQSVVRPLDELGEVAVFDAADHRQQVCPHTPIALTGQGRAVLGPQSLDLVRLDAKGFPNLVKCHSQNVHRTITPSSRVNDFIYSP